MKLEIIRSLATCSLLYAVFGMGTVAAATTTTTTTQQAADAAQRQRNTGTTNENSVRQMGQVEGMECPRGYIKARDGRCYTPRELCQKNNAKCD